MPCLLSLTSEVLHRRSGLYAIRDASRSTPPDEHLSERHALANLITGALERSLQAPLAALLGKSGTTDAILNALELWLTLTQFAEGAPLG